MAVQFIPEDGSGVPDANSYLTVEELIDYSEILGYDWSEQPAELLEKRLIRSAIIMDSRYRDRFPGERATSNQALEWPREGAKYVDGGIIDPEIVPKEIKYATVELINLLLIEAQLQPTIGTAAGQVTMERVKADVIEEETRYSEKNMSTVSTFTTVEDALSRITGGIGNRGRLRIIRVGGDG